MKRAEPAAVAAAPSPRHDAIAGIGAAARIDRIETIPLRLPLRNAFEIATGGARVHLDVLIVRVHTAGGAVGVGETQAWRRHGSAETLGGMKAAIDEVLAPVAIGRSAFAAPAIADAMDRALWSSLYAKAAVADALLDLQGRLLGVPAWCLMGGLARDALDLCGVLPIGTDHAKVIDAALACEARGFRSFVLKVGGGTGDVELVRALRSALPDAGLRLDANASLDYPAAAALVQGVAGLGVEAFEQPLAPSDVEGMRALARSSPVCIIADEAVANAQDLMRVIERRAAHGVQTKTAKNGGAWRTRGLWSMAAAAGLRIYPGNHSATSVAVAAVAHLAAAWPGPLESGPFAVGLVDNLVQDIVRNPVEVRGAQVVVPRGPGFGVDLDEDLVARYRVDR